MLKFLDESILKFLVVGVVNTIFGAGLMFLLYNAFGCSYWVSSICNYLFGSILSFILNKFFTFKNREKSVVQICLFALNILVCYVFAYVLSKKIIYFLLDSFSPGFKDNISMLWGMFLFTGLNYFGQRFIVFKENVR